MRSYTGSRQEGEIVLEAADLLEPVDQVGEADADQLVLLADGIEGAVGAHDDRLAPSPEEQAAGLTERLRRPPDTGRPAEASSSGFLPKRFLKDVQPDDIAAPYAPEMYALG